MSNKGRMLFAGARGEPAKALRPLRVLVVDDDRDTVLSLLMLMREEGHEVTAPTRTPAVTSWLRCLISRRWLGSSELAIT